ncbi:hypothetical protein ES705_48236 [subsurface metagenome]
MRLEPELREQRQPYIGCMRITIWSNSTLRPKLIVPSLAMPAIRSFGTKKQRWSGLLPLISREYMPGGWEMIPPGCGG